MKIDFLGLNVFTYYVGLIMSYNFTNIVKLKFCAVYEKYNLEKYCNIIVVVKIEFRNYDFKNVVCNRIKNVINIQKNKEN